jgi:hypothetical protein
MKNNSVLPAKAEPGAEAAEPSPGEKGPTQKPSAADLERAERMYRDAAKKLADEGAADFDKPPHAKSQFQAIPMVAAIEALPQATYTDSRWVAAYRMHLLSCRCTCT